jgi:WD40 repeat protein
MGMLNQPVANFFDMRSERFIRNLQVPGSISAIAVNGSMATIASAAGNAFVFDLRCREPAVATIEAHRDRVTALDYRRAEPNYLASGSTDGIVKVWDDRKWGFPVYTLDKAHHPQAAVMALHWNPDKRTTIFSGDSHGMLHLLDTHGDAARSSPQANVATSAAVARLCSPAQGVNTGAPITAIVSAAGSSEVATAHRNPGQIQVRRVATFQHVATFSSQSSNGEPIISMSLSPDKERICAAQLDETLKFWKVFDDQSSGNQAGRGARRPSTCGDFSSQFHEDLR